MSHINGVLDVSIDVLVAMTPWVWCHPQCAPVSRLGLVIIVESRRVTWKNWQYIWWKVTTYMTGHNSAGGLCFVQQLQILQTMGGYYNKWARLTWAVYHSQHSKTQMTILNQIQPVRWAMILGCILVIVTFKPLFCSCSARISFLNQHTKMLKMLILFSWFKYVLW